MIERVAPREVVRRLQGDPEGIVLLDVRERDERALVAIEPSLHIPMGEVPSRLREIPRDRFVVVYCHVGVRSELVASFLDGEGFERVANLVGGIDAWSIDVDPALPRYS